MFFIVKSAFWLMLVFYCMSWPGGEGPETLARHAAGDMAQRARTAAVDTAVSACKSDPAGCLMLAGNAARGRTATMRPALRGGMVD
ncbi:MAG: hypothetical protein V9G24_11120 [Rhodoblastus sp.]